MASVITSIDYLFDIKGSNSALTPFAGLTHTAHLNLLSILLIIFNAADIQSCLAKIINANMLQCILNSVSLGMEKNSIRMSRELSLERMRFKLINTYRDNFVFINDAGSNTSTEHSATSIMSRGRNSFRNLLEEAEIFEIRHSNTLRWMLRVPRCTALLLVVFR